MKNAYERFVRPLLFSLDAEAAQFAALWKSDTFRGRVSAFVEGSPARDR